MATTDSLSADPSVERYDADELGQYRSLSSLAVVSVVLGCCSALMFATPVLVVVPLAAVATALLALRGIATSEGGLTGTRLALVGLALALMFSVASFARVQVRDSLLQQQVEQVGQQWLTLASHGQVEQMLGMMTGEAAKKLQPEVELAQPESFFSGMLTSALMRQDPLVAALTNLSEEGPLRLQVREAIILATSAPAQGRLEYSVTSSGSESVSCALGFKRFKSGQDQQAWFVDSWSLEE